MPFTPFHLGPALLLGLIVFSYIDFPTFLIANVIVDVEPFLVLALNLEYPLHGFLHSFLGGTLMAFLLATIMSKVREWFAPILAFFKLEQKASFRGVLLASFLGIYLHILLDSPLYPEMKPLYPLDVNPFISRSIPTSFEIYALCTISFIVGIAIYAIKLVYQKKMQ